MANQFEREIFGTFETLVDRAVLFTLYPPMRAAGMIGKMPGYVPTGKSPYDLAGYYLDGAIAIGVELKETKDHDNRLPVVKPESKGNGLHYHQLEALCRLHNAGGVALLLWNNGGIIGRFDGQRLVAFKVAYDASLRVEAAGKEVAKGGRSLEWSAFEKVTEATWLPPRPAPAPSPQAKRLLAEAVKKASNDAFSDNDD